ncbi:hypothetical protein K2X40_02805 [Candidatus Babeliales bacterium]|nr:hypothetical protein [Candidatus Babeliales bacterium]
MKNRFIPYIFMFSLSGIFLAPLCSAGASPELTALEQSLGALKAKLTKLGTKLNRLVHPLHADAKDLRQWLELKKGTSGKIMLDPAFIKTATNYTDNAAAQEWINMIGGNWGAIDAALTHLKDNPGALDALQVAILNQLKAHLEAQVQVAGVNLADPASYADDASHWIVGIAGTGTLFNRILAVKNAYNPAPTPATTGPADYAERITQAITGNIAGLPTDIEAIFRGLLPAEINDAPKNNKPKNIKTWLESKRTAATKVRKGGFLQATNNLATQVVVAVHAAHTARALAVAAVDNVSATALQIGNGSYNAVLAAINAATQAAQEATDAIAAAVNAVDNDTGMKANTHVVKNAHSKDLTLVVANTDGTVLPLTMKLIDKLAARITKINVATKHNADNPLAAPQAVLNETDISAAQAINEIAEAKTFIDSLVVAGTAIGTVANEAAMKTLLDGAGLPAEQLKALQDVAREVQTGLHNNGGKNYDKIDWIVNYAPTPTVIGINWAAANLAVEITTHVNDNTTAQDALVNLFNSPADNAVKIITRDAGTGVIAIGNKAAFTALLPAQKDQLLQLKDAIRAQLTDPDDQTDLDGVWTALTT